MRILLWDIDGTLISSGGAGLQALANAVGASPAASQALGRMRLDGMTDRGIARILCAAIRHRDVPDEPLEKVEKAVTTAEIDAMLAEYLARLQAAVTSAPRYRVMDGVVDLLDGLGPDVAVHALGTGNIEQGARIKLERGGIWQRFAFGGFGSDAEIRSEILKAAWTKAERYLGRKCEASEFVVIGDTPKDIAAAHACGFACVAVASGRHSTHELQQNGADLAVETLAQPGMGARILDVRYAQA